MKPAAFFSMVLLLVGLAGPSASAQPQPVNLTGTWDFVFDELQFGDGTRAEPGSFDIAMTITEQSGSILRGNIKFTTNLTNLHDGEKSVTQRDVGLMGVISWSGDEITLISHGETDSWVISGRIVNAQVMELIGYETGEHAWISKKIAVRRQE